MPTRSFARRSASLRARQIRLKAFIESALRDAIEASEREAEPGELKTHVVSGNGLQPGRSWGELVDLTYEGRAT